MSPPQKMSLAEIKGLCRRVGLAGVEVNLLEMGRGFPLVLVHGVNASVYTWRGNLAALAEGFRVLALDLPGCGFSDKPEDFPYTIEGCAEFLGRALEELGVESAFFLGHSLGGAVCQSLALGRPGLARGLVLISSTSLFGPRVEHPPRFAENLALFTYHDKSHLTRELLAVYKQTGASAQARQAAAELLADSARQRIQPTALNLPPGLVIWGRQDQIFPARQAGEVGGLFQRARVELLEGCGHAPHEELPAPVNSLVLEFLETLLAEDEDRL